MTVATGKTVCVRARQQRPPEFVAVRRDNVSVAAMRDRDTETCRTSSAASALALNVRYAGQGWRAPIRVTGWTRGTANHLWPRIRLMS